MDRIILTKGRREKSNAHVMIAPKWPIIERFRFKKGNNKEIGEERKKDISFEKQLHGYLFVSCPDTYFK
ncbi:MAG: hypothetical protein AB1656_14690 [Candidatus Omnitrophota bacterium]